MRRRWGTALGAGITALLVVAGTALTTGTAAGSPGRAEAVPVFAAPLGPGSDRLLSGEVLTSGQQIRSTNTSHRLVMQGDGNVVLYGPTGARWSSRTFVPGTRLVLQGDGNLVAYTPGGTPVWHTRTAGSGANRLIMQNDGNAVLYRPDGRAVWASNTAVPMTNDILFSGQRLRAGQQLVSRNGAYRFVMQSDGNIVLYAPTGYLWTTRTSVPGTSLVLQGDGNLVAYTPDGRPVWHTRTTGSGANRLVMQGDGNAVLYRPDGRAVWSSGTASTVPASLRGKDFTVIPTTSRVVALTFDAGANGAGLPSILSTLQGRGVPATFFLTGDFVEDNRAAVADIRARGHRVGNHSMTHPYFTTLSDAGIRAEVINAERTILGAGADPRGLFRFPFGDVDARTISVVNTLGYVPVRWTVDTLGWQGTTEGMTAQKVVDRALGALRPGEIVLMHVGSHPRDGSTLDADALPTMIDRMRAAGYSFVTLDALFR